MLNAMTDSLGLKGAYGATLDRIKGQGGGEAKLGMDTLMWIFHAERPLKPDELLHALAVEIGSPNLNSDNIPSIGTLLYCCQGLVVIDKEASTVRLIHTTLHEYFRAHPDLFSTAHSTIAETCLSYLDSHQVKALSASPSRDFRRTRFREDSGLDWEDSSPFSDLLFLEYSSLHWGTHAKKDLSDRAKLLALKLFDDYNNHISAKILVNAQEGAQGGYLYTIDFNTPFLFSGLHCASTFGIDEIVASLVEVEGCDINQKDGIDNTPLVCAAMNGHEGVVKIFLERDDINPETSGSHGRTPLCHAAENGHEGVVKILLGRDDVNPDKQGASGNTPLGLAAGNGHEGVVKILLGRDDVDPNKPGRFGRTPLCCAADTGREGVVKILLERDDVDPEKPGECDLTPLCFAARGHAGVVKMLLERHDVNPDKPNYTNQTPLSLAAERGYEGVVKILLERHDVNPNEPNRGGETPLSLAVKNGHAGVITLLLPLTSTTPARPKDEEPSPSLPPYNISSLYATTTSTMTTTTPQTHPPPPLPPSTYSRTTSPRTSKRHRLLSAFFRSKPAATETHPK